MCWKHCPRQKRASLEAGILLGLLELADGLVVTAQQLEADGQVVLEVEVVGITLDPGLVHREFLSGQFQLEFLQLGLGLGLRAAALLDLLLEQQHLVAHPPHLGLFEALADVGVALGEIQGLGEDFFGLVVDFVLQVEFGQLDVTGQIVRVPGDVLLELLDLGLLLDRRPAGGGGLLFLVGFRGEGVQGLLDGQAGDRPLHLLVAGPDLLATVQAGDGLVVLLPLFERLAQCQLTLKSLELASRAVFR